MRIPHKLFSMPYILILILFFIKLMTVVIFYLISGANHIIALRLCIEIFILEISLLMIKKSFRVFILPFFIFHACEITNFFIVGQIIDVITILNINEYKALGIYTLIKIFIIFTVYILLWVPSYINNNSIINNTRYNIIYTVGFISLILTIHTPIFYFINTIKQAYTIYSFRINPENKSSFLNMHVSSQKIPYNYKDYNIILLFTEGTSNYVLSEQITPNAIYLKNKGLTFDNYFSHTAATFRGIRGQLLSGYQFIGGYYRDKTGLSQTNKLLLKSKIPQDINLVSILSENGYKTIFISPHAQNGTFTNFLEQIGFSNIISAYADKTSTDKELYDLIYKNIMHEHEKGEKFFIASYIYGTHFDMDSPDLKYGDGSNSYLNKFYNQDHWFGEFFKKLENTDVLNNTLLIFTSDHATYPSLDCKKTFNTKSDYFVDRIPLIFYTKNMQHVVIDAKNRNSIDFAPTVLNMLNIDSPNYFLGKSLFTDTGSVFSYISTVGGFFDTSTGEIIKKDPDEDILKKIKDYFLIFG